MADPTSWIGPDGSGDCPHCGRAAQFDPVQLRVENRVNFLSMHGGRLLAGECPSCKGLVVEWVELRAVYAPGRKIATGVVDGERIGIYPKARRLILSEHIPKDVRDDLGEAYAVLPLSKRAAAVLAGRALQNALRLAEFNHPTSRDLFDEIDLAKADPRTPSTLHDLLDAVRTARNEGAHPNRDVLGEMIVIADELPPLLITTVEEFCDVYFVKGKERRSILDSWKNRKQGKPPAGE